VFYPRTYGVFRSLEKEEKRGRRGEGEERGGELRGMVTPFSLFGCSKNYVSEEGNRYPFS
jgi:hypothetical protein